MGSGVSGEWRTYVLFIQVTWESNVPILKRSQEITVEKYNQLTLYSFFLSICPSQE